MAEKDSKYDPLVIEKVFPAPAALLVDKQPAVNVMAKECLFVLDANTLLAPFLIGKESLKDVKKVFASLVSQDRLFLPAQAVREYAKHRASKIADIYTHIQQKLSSLPSNPQPLAIPMFEDVPAYTAVGEGADKVRSAVKEYKSKLQELLSQVRNWHGDDPVSTLYASIFLESHVIEHGKSLEDLSADLERRTIHGIPPGFKDKAKPDGGIGDVAIWHTILKLGSDRKRDVIFVSNDAKPDWMVRGGDEGLFPKFELIAEFHRTTGHRFWILPFDRFLELLGAAPGTVVEVASTTDVPSTSFATKIASDFLAAIANVETLDLDAVFHRLHGSIMAFLGPDESDEDAEYEYIHDQRFSALVKRFGELLSVYLTQNDLKFGQPKTLKRVLALLIRMDELNREIAYHAARMKRSTTEQQRELRELAEEFIELHMKITTGLHF
ncbi:PIN-like domain-containing protein [Corallococcus exiguus]|uniref:DUF4935 domain-containing protein n=1 Tax=Corallococcus exiguus TaxID=83462 RepID=A0A7X4YC88_9BACT|nr:PIN domain-containing protein [Corallococcus exiguus]NBC41662.1 DUF4935 domain-containing protein [Corallococcus exiguus]TNV67498.1 hypothetical protein FH620_01075 [Corallococcus exiguus]